jgi:hypothetical protein
MAAACLRLLRATWSRHKLNDFRTAAMVDMSYKFHPKLDALLTNREAAWKLKALAANEELGRKIREGMASPGFVARLERIEEILSGAGAKKVDREAVKSRMVIASFIYATASWFAERASKATLHKAAGPIADTLKNFKSDENRAELLRRLGASINVPAKGREASHAAAVKTAQARLDDVIRALEKIGGEPTPPPQEERRTRDLDALVHLLAENFEELTGTRFTQDWRTEKSRRKPLSAGAQFAFEVVEFIDSKRLAELPGSTRRVVSDRLNFTFQKTV